jgi:hypothetical protein
MHARVLLTNLYFLSRRIVLNVLYSSRCLGLPEVSREQDLFCNGTHGTMPKISYETRERDEIFAGTRSSGTLDRFYLLAELIVKPFLYGAKTLAQNAHN